MDCAQSFETVKWVAYRNWAGGITVSNPGHLERVFYYTYM